MPTTTRQHTPLHRPYERPFRPLGDANDHFWLMTGLARAMKVDLAAAIAEGRITRAGYSDMVTACRGCRGAAACAKLRDSVQGHQTIPDFCENADTLARLKD